MIEYLNTYYRVVSTLILVGIVLYFILLPKKKLYLLNKCRKRINIQLHISGLLALEICIIAILCFVLDKNLAVKIIYCSLALFWLITSRKDYQLLKLLYEAEEELNPDLENKKIKNSE